MSANDRIRQLFRLGLDDTQDTEYAIESFFGSEIWLKYPDEINWDEVVLEAVNDIRNTLARRVNRPAVFHNDYD